MEYSEVKEQIKQKLPVQKEFGDSENLLELGLSSNRDHEAGTTSGENRE